MTEAAKVTVAKVVGEDENQVGGLRQPAQPAVKANRPSAVAKNNLQMFMFAGAGQFSGFSRPRRITSCGGKIIFGFSENFFSRCAGTVRRSVALRMSDHSPIAQAAPFNFEMVRDLRELRSFLSRYEQDILG